jgi:DNA modification methylase
MMTIKKIAIDKINPASYNPRKDLKPDDKAYKQLVKSMSEFGCVEPLVWNKRTGNLVGGHQRFKVILAQGAKEAQVSVVNLSLEKEKVLNVALNKISGDWDQEKLALLIDELVKAPDIDIETTGFELPEVEQLLADIINGDETEEQFDISEELEGNKPIVTQPGDLIELGLHGEHRLLCGDATKLSDIARLMGDHRARLCHTDPPYGVNYNRNNRPSAKKAKNSSPKTESIRNDDLTPKRYEAWFSKVINAFAEAMVSGAPFYIWNSHKNFGLMNDLLYERNFKISSVITWAKESFARDRTDLYRHPTQKALELAERAIRNSSKRGDIVFDPFLGSGTTLIAAARLGRRCFGMEIEPKYCDCIVRRYIALAGKSAVSAEIIKRYLSEEVSL